MSSRAEFDLAQGGALRLDAALFRFL